MSSKLSLKQVLATYQGSMELEEESTNSSQLSISSELQDSDSKTEQSLSPLQLLLKEILSKANINMKMLTLLGKAFPGLGESLRTMDNPHELHIATHEIVMVLVKGLEADHASGYITQDELLSLDTAEAGEEGTESIPSGSNGYGEVNADGSPSGGISSSVLGTEATSEVLVLRYEAEVQGGEGA